MVSAKVKRDLEIAFKDLANTSVDLDLYSGKLLSVAFDVFTSDTFIAGIADKILSGDTVDNNDRIILAKPLILDEICWVTNNGQTVDIKDDKLLFELAQKIENLRKICVNIVS
jgi:hypothetical protein